MQPRPDPLPRAEIHHFPHEFGLSPVISRPATDCVDTDCAGDPACPTVTPEDCSNGIDDDRDGAVDCADSDCRGDAACPAPRFDDVRTITTEIRTHPRDERWLLSVEVHAYGVTGPPPPSSDGTVIDTLGPCTAFEGPILAEPVSPDPPIDLGAGAVFVRVGAGAWQALRRRTISDGYGYYLEGEVAAPATGTPVAIQVRMGSRGTYETSVEIANIDITAAVPALERTGAYPYYRVFHPDGADQRVEWSPDARAGGVQLWVTRAGSETDDRVHSTVRCQVDDSPGGYTLPWAILRHVQPTDFTEFPTTWPETDFLGVYTRSDRSETVAPDLVMATTSTASAHGVAYLHPLP